MVAIDVTNAQKAVIARCHDAITSEIAVRPVDLVRRVGTEDAVGQGRTASPVEHPAAGRGCPVQRERAVPSERAVGQGRTVAEVRHPAAGITSPILNHQVLKDGV